MNDRFILLSILIPTYNYYEGLLRIVRNLPENDSRLEIIISDDSTDELISQKIELESYDRYIYKKNYPPFGAVENWNALLRLARGEYILIMHHDEYFLDSNDVVKLLDFLSENRLKFDLILLHLFFKTKKKLVPLPILSNKVRGFLFMNLESYIKIRNFIGPTSTLVFKNSISPYFDSQLKYLVDMKFYIDLFQSCTCKAVYPAIIITDQIREGSITSKLAARKHKIRKTETLYDSSFRITDPLNLFLFKVIDYFFWFPYRFFTITVIKILNK